MEIIPDSDPWYSIQYFPILRYFSGTFSRDNNLLHIKTKLWKEDEIVSELEIVSRDVARNSGRET